MRELAIRMTWLALMIGLLAPVGARAQDRPRAGDEVAAPDQDGGKLPSPPPISEVNLGPALPTIPIAREQLRYNEVVVDTAALPRDRDGIWVLDFAFKPLRVIDVDIPGKGRRKVHYLYYTIINRTGKPRMLVPQFSLVTDSGKRYEDAVLPQAVKVIQDREDPTKNLLGAVSVMGMIPPSTKEGIDDAVFGVAVWEGVDPAADQLKIFVRGLSDGFQMVPSPDGSEPVVRYKTLRIDFIRRGDERNIHSREIQLLQPPYEWIYW